MSEIAMPCATFAIVMYMVSAVLGEIMMVDIHPEDRNVSFNEVVSFSCEISYADVLVWHLNDVVIEDYDWVNEFQTTRKDGSKLMGNLTLPITGYNKGLNNTQFKCMGVAESVLPYVVLSASAELRLQGTVGSPEEMNATLEADHLRTNWLPPYTLDGIRIEYNVTFSSNSSSLGNGSNTTTETYYNLPTPVTDEDYDIMVCATAKTVAGVGPKACAPQRTVLRIPATDRPLDQEEDTIASSSGLVNRNLLLMTLSLVIRATFVP